MTILDRGGPAKTKEDNSQSRQQNLENNIRKQRSRPGHSVRDRTVSQHRVGRISPNNDFNFWNDSTATHRRLSVDISQGDNSSTKLQLKNDDLALRGLPKPRGLSKSNIASTSNCDSFSAANDTVSNEVLHSEVDAQQGLSKISHSSLNMPISTQPNNKNLGRGGKKNVDKKLSHKKKQRRNVPYNVKCKPIKSHSKGTAQLNHQRPLHSNSKDNCLDTSEKQSGGLHQYVPNPLANDGQFMETGSQYDHYANKPPNFIGKTAHSSDQYVNFAIASKSSRNSPNIFDDHNRNQDNETVSKELNDTKHNSDDEHEQERLKRLHHGVDFKQLESEFEQKLKSVRGFIIKPMGEDGACLFRAVADQVYGDQNMHDEVRKNCMNYMTQNSDYYSNYVTEDFKSYIDRKRDLSAFGNHLEMQAMAELYSRPFEVYQYTTEPINTFQTSNLSTNPPIRVSYHQNSHYNSVIDPYKATIGVGLGLPSFKPGMVDKTMLNTALKASGEMWEQQMLNDKVQATDWESTDDAILEQVARESYMEYIERKTNSDIQEVKDDHSDSAKSKHIVTDSPCSKTEPLKIVKEFPKKNNKTTTAVASDWIAEDEEWQVLSKVLANSQKEYMDALKQQATHSKATCSKYT